MSTDWPKGIVGTPPAPTETTGLTVEQLRAELASLTDLARIADTAPTFGAAAQGISREALQTRIDIVNARLVELGA